MHTCTNITPGTIVNLTKTPGTTRIAIAAGEKRGAGDVDHVGALQVARQGPDGVDALDLHQRVDRLYANLRLATRHGLPDPQRALRRGCRDEPRFRFVLGGNPQLFEGLRQLL